MNDRAREKTVWEKDVFKELVPDLLEAFKSRGTKLTEEQAANIAQKLHQVLTYEARIGFFGKTGCGKSSLCNQLFGVEIAKISDIASCTRSPQEYLLKLPHEKNIVLVDVPGAGESVLHDDKYSALYENVAPTLDAILWVIKADDKAFSVDETYLKKHVKPHKNSNVPIIVVINQVDKLNPLREWNSETNEPGITQSRLIKEKVSYIAKSFSIAEKLVVPVSALEGYNISHLVETIILSLPNQKKISVLKEVPEEKQSETAKEDAKAGFFETAKEILKEVWESVKPHVGHILVEVLKIWGKK